VDENKDGCLNEAQWNKVELWFQYKAFLPGSDDDLDAELALKQQQDAYDRATMLKKVLWDMFAAPAKEAMASASIAPTAQSSAAVVNPASSSGGGAPTTEFSEASSTASGLNPSPSTTTPLPAPTASTSGANLLIDIKATLLHLCPDRDMFHGIKKAFSVATSSIASNARAQPQQVLKVVYPLGADKGRDIHRSPFSAEDIEKVVQAVYSSRKTANADPSEPPSVAAEQLMYSAGGERLVAHMLHRYQWKDIYVSTKLV
jgi:hypothetical protein